MGIADVSLAVHRDSEVVFDGYKSVLQLLYIIERTVFMLLYKVVAPYVFGEEFRFTTVLPLLAFPAVFPIYLAIREKAIHDALTSTNEAQKDVMNQVNEITTHYSLIIDFFRRNRTVQCFFQKVRR